MADDPVVLNLDGNDEPIEQLWAFLAIDEHGREGICSAAIGNQHFPMITARKSVLANMRKAANHISRTTGKPVRLMRFTNRELIETITAGMN